MAIASCYIKFVSNYRQEIHDQASHLKAVPRNLGTNFARRREVVLSSSTFTILLAISAATNEVNDSRTALLQKYLKKSEENKAKNDKERLDNYYKRNYKDYFGFVEGTLRAKEEEQLSESEKGILEWLDKNK